MADERKTHRFAIRPDRTAWTVFEIWTGEPAVIALAPQTGLSQEDAQETADLVNRHARGGDRSLRQ